MRKAWIAIATIALAVGIVAAYRAARPGPPPRQTRTADPESATPPGASSPARVDTRTPLRDAAPAPEPPPERLPAAPVAGDDANTPVLPVPRSDLPLPREAVAPYAPPLSPPPPAYVDSSRSAPPTAAQPPAPAAQPPTATAPIVEPAKGDETDGLVDDPDSDRRAPVLDSLRFDPPEIKDGGATVLSVTATDDLSGVKSVSGALFSPSGSAVVTFTAYDAGGNGVFTAPLAVPHRAETGDWFVGTLQLVDRAENPLNLTFVKSSVPPGGLLRVASAESDASAPSLRGVAVDLSQVDPGEKNRIVVEAEDDRSGVASVTGAFQNRSGSALIPFTCRPAGASAWEADVPVPANADCGEWTLRHLILTDKAQNAGVFNTDDPQVGRVGFYVSGGGACDAEPPVIDGMYFTPPVVSNEAATEVTLTVRVHDEGSGVASLFGRIEGPPSPNGQVARIPFECVPDPGDPEAQMIAKIAVPQHAARGVWSVIWLHATDKAKNAHPYYKDDPALAGGSFTVD